MEIPFIDAMKRILGINWKGNPFIKTMQRIPEREIPVKTLFIKLDRISGKNTVHRYNEEDFTWKCY